MSRIIDIVAAIGVSSGLISDAFSQEARCLPPYAECVENRISEIRTRTFDKTSMLETGQNQCDALSLLLGDIEDYESHLLSKGDMTVAEATDLEDLIGKRTDILDLARDYRTTADKFFEKVPDDFCDVHAPAVIANKGGLDLS